MPVDPNYPRASAEASAVADIMRRHLQGEVIEVSRGSEKKTSVLLRPDGSGQLEATSLKQFLDEYLTAPERRKGTARAVTLESFIAMVLRSKDADSVIFANPDQTTPSLTAILDYNPAGAENSKARFGQHRIVYSFPVSDPWKAWLEKDEKPMTVQEFGEFLEDRLADVSSPDAAGSTSVDFAKKLQVTFATPQRLLELSRGLSLRVGHQVKNAMTLQTGEVSVQFVTEHTDVEGKPLNIPSAFLITVPVFRAGAPYEIAARLRYRTMGGGIQWFYQLHRLDQVFDHAFEEALGQVKSDTSDTVPIYQGSPEQ